MGEDADPFDVIVELLRGQRANHGRNLAQRTVTVLFGEVDFDVELHFASDRRRIEENFVRGHDPAQNAADNGRKPLSTGRQPGIRPPRQPLIEIAMFQETVLRQPLVEPPRGTEQPLQQFAGSRTTG